MSSFKLIDLTISDYCGLALKQTVKQVVTAVFSIYETSVIVDFFS